MNKSLFFLMLPVVALVTGCPRNEYTVELTPRGNAIERNLTFYRADGQETNGTPKYQEFPSNELAAIAALFPVVVTKEGAGRYVATGTFSGALPADLGGAGSYSNLATSLGSASFYIERFRGNDDPVALTMKRFQAADQLTDLIIGWAESELGKEPRFADLRRFLDGNFRHDLKNVGGYLAPVWQLHANRKTDSSDGDTDKATEKLFQEQAVRYGQYLVERGYLQTGDLANVLLGESSNQDAMSVRLMQRLVCTKLGLSITTPPSGAVAFLASDEAMEKSWTNYLTTTTNYQARVREWESRPAAERDQEKPKPEDFPGDLLLAIAGLKFELGNSDDSLTVKLAPPAPPLHTNGRWDEDAKKVVWQWDMEEKEKSVAQPPFCYANWTIPDREFQSRHFGKVLLEGDDLCRYCLWHGGLDTKHATEWEIFLGTLQPGVESKSKLEAFHFSNEPARSATNNPASPADFARQLILGALAEKKEADGK